MAADRRHPAVNDVYLTLVGASNTLADVQRRLDLEFRASYPDHANPAKLVGRVKRVQEEVAALKDLCRDLLAQKQELIDMMRTSLAAQRSATQRLLASSGLPLMTDDEEAACASLKQVIDEWTDQLKPMAGRFSLLCSSSLDFVTGNSLQLVVVSLAGGPDGENEDTNQILFSAIL
ncbi:unnamed protein product [Triticum turgidum subsp. durum]|uniref:Protein FAM33A n=1 Tax=Triticum turgidum subsp. durum TaxID=4567 RepID=A0A9R1R421_TRITD|nr:unnamed protein product [Triticum turgidum subsp. durum]